MGARLEIRVDDAEKDAYERAATLCGQERSDWIRDTLNLAAQRVLKARPPGR